MTIQASEGSVDSYNSIDQRRQEVLQYSPLADPSERIQVTGMDPRHEATTVDSSMKQVKEATDLSVDGIY